MKSQYLIDLAQLMPLFYQSDSVVDQEKGEVTGAKMTRKLLIVGCLVLHALAGLLDRLNRCGGHQKGHDEKYQN